ncbi:hypothetical protein Tco_0794306 [Tanacetum coccineum]
MIRFFNAESNLIESLLNRDTLIDSSPKIDCLLEEFSGELAHIDPIQPRIENADFDLEEEIYFIENLLYDNSSPTTARELNGIANTLLESPSHLISLLRILEHKAYWALKHANFDLKTTGDHRKLQLNELNELHDQAYENSLIYKERTKKFHDSKIKNHIFNVGDRVLLFNSCLKIFSGKLKTRWSGPFTITKVFPYGTIELSQPDGPNFKVNGHRVKHYFRGDLPPKVVQDLHTLSKDE